VPRFRFTTDHLVVDTRRCTACGECVEACKRDVLKVRGIQRIFNDRHVHVVKPDACNACMACVSVCPDGALARLESDAE
jgi:NAD-dependent dihydropyrimidine dehydrogenase PreA subunit